MILCLSLIFSSWLFSRSQTNLSVTETGDSLIETVESRPYVAENGNDEWKKLLTKIDPKDQVETNLTKTDPNKFDDTTLTAQLARDFFSQYMLTKQGGKEVEVDDVNKIVESISESSLYTSISAPVYVLKNLKITSKSDPETMRKYKTSVNSSLKNRSSQIKDNPVTIVEEAVKTGNENTLKRLDPLIIIAKGFIDDFLAMEVPEGASILHLNLLNSYSILLADLEALRVTIKDPTRALLAVSKYNEHVTIFYKALNNMNSFLIRF